MGTVRLAAGSAALVRRGALLLEDALRTASFPEAGPGRVLLIRSLPVGIIRGHLPPASLALTLERRVRELAVSAVHVADSSAPHREAVLFRDDAEPPTVLAGRLARGEPVEDWFWPLAVPGFHPRQPRDEALRLVLFAALQTSAGPAAAVRLVEALHSGGGLDVLLDSLREQEGTVLLRAFGGSPPDSSSPPEPAPDGVPEEALPSSPLRSMLTQWVETWGGGDARSVWLTTVALVTERRGRLADPRLPARAARIASRLVSRPDMRRVRNSARTETPLAPAEEREPSSAASPDGPTRAPSSQEPELRTEPPALEPLPTTVASAAPRAHSLAAPTELGSREEAAPAPDTVPPLARRPAVERPVLELAPAEKEAPSETSPAPLADWLERPRATMVGGLLFLVPILERLGIAALLEENPALLEFDLPERLLGLIAERVGAPVTDPSRVLFTLPMDDPRSTRCPFQLPEHLRAQVAAEGAPLALHSGEPLRRTVVTDASGRLPLAVTYGVAPEPELLGPGRTILPALNEEDDLNLLLRSLLTAVRRWCRRHARLGLQALVRRPGRITATRTHIDVVFNIQETDLRVRRLGLDIDPGWIPWLGRVVRFHYLHGDTGGHG